MRGTTTDREEEALAFAGRAAKAFAEDGKLASYTYSPSPMPGDFLALRWGMMDDSVLVLRIDEDWEPTNYQGLIKQYAKGGRA